MKILCVKKTYDNKKFWVLEQNCRCYKCLISNFFLYIEFWFYTCTLDGIGTYFECTYDISLVFWFLDLDFIPELGYCFWKFKLKLELFLDLNVEEVELCYNNLELYFAMKFVCVFEFIVINGCLLGQGEWMGLLGFDILNLKYYIWYLHFYKFIALEILVFGR